MGLDHEILDRLMAGYEKPDNLLGENGLLKQIQKRLLERALNSELSGLSAVVETA